MQNLALALLFACAASAALAEPVQEARSATAACLSAVIDGAPVDDIDGDDVSIRRGKDPVSCTVQVNAGEPVVIRDAVLTAIKRRSDLFTPARSRWEPAGAASRETFCNIAGRRALAVHVVTARPGGLPILTASVFETTQRDERCDRDLGLEGATPSASTGLAKELTPQPVKKKRRFPRIPGLSAKD